MKFVRLTPSLLILPALMLAGCGPKRTAQGLMDDPRTHSDRGFQYWERGDLDRAADEFRLALELDRRFAPALAGKGLVEASKGRFDEADDLIDDAVSRGDDRYFEGYMARGILIGMRERGGRDEDWYEDAVDAFERATEIAPRNEQIWFWRGRVLTWAYQFRLAGDAFRRSIELNGPFSGKANEAWSQVQKIERAAPGTRVGRRIALVDTLTRADAAALFIAELEIDRLLGRTRGPQVDTSFQAIPDPRALPAPDAPPSKVASDIAGHWARNFIEDVVGLGIRGLQVYPDRTFQPGVALTRAEFAFLAEDALLAVFNDRTLATRHIGSSSRFSDVPGGSPYHNAISNAVDKNIMDAKADGSFGARLPVSGADALLTIRLIKELRR